MTIDCDEPGEKRLIIIVRDDLTCNRCLEGGIIVTVHSARVFKSQLSYKEMNSQRLWSVIFKVLFSFIDS